MNYVKIFSTIKEHCLAGESGNIDCVMRILNDEADLPITRAVDLYLGQVTNPNGIERIKYYLFKGTQIQRNYCTLFFSRQNEWKIVNEAYRAGLVDWVQAYSR